MHPVPFPQLGYKISLSRAQTVKRFSLRRMCYLANLTSVIQRFWAGSPSGTQITSGSIQFSDPEKNHINKFLEILIFRMTEVGRVSVWHYLLVLAHFWKCYHVSKCCSESATSSTWFHIQRNDPAKRNQWCRRPHTHSQHTTISQPGSPPHACADASDRWRNSWSSSGWWGTCPVRILWCPSEVVWGLYLWSGTGRREGRRSNTGRSGTPASTAKLQNCLQIIFLILNNFGELGKILRQC